MCQTQTGTCELEEPYLLEDTLVSLSKCHNRRHNLIKRQTYFDNRSGPLTFFSKFIDDVSYFVGRLQHIFSLPFIIQPGICRIDIRGSACGVTSRLNSARGNHEILVRGLYSSSPMSLGVSFVGHFFMIQTVKVGRGYVTQESRIFVTKSRLQQSFMVLSVRQFFFTIAKCKCSVRRILVASAEYIILRSSPAHT